MAEKAVESVIQGTWKRPELVPYPNIWLKENGIVIRDVTPDLEPYIVHHMVTHFMKDEPLYKSNRVLEDPTAIQDNIRMWSDLIFPNRITIVALPEESPGADLKPVDADNPPQVLGCNLLYVTHKDDPPEESLSNLLKSTAMRTIIKTCIEFGNQVDILTEYGVDHYVDAAGLSVCPKERGKGLGLMLLRARIELCKGLNIPLTKSIFTAIQSQKISEKAGFKIIYEKSYEDLIEDGKLIFPGITSTKAMQLKVYILT